MKKLFAFGVINALMYSGLVFAQTPTNTSTTTVETPSEFLSNPSLLAGVKSYNDFGRPQELNSPGQRQFRSKK